MRQRPGPWDDDVAGGRDDSAFLNALSAATSLLEAEECPECGAALAPDGHDDHHLYSRCTQPECDFTGEIQFMPFRADVRSIEADRRLHERGK